MERKATLQSLRIERTAKPFAPLTMLKVVFFFLSLPNEIQYTIREEYSTERKAI